MRPAGCTGSRELTEAGGVVVEYGLGVPEGLNGAGRILNVVSAGNWKQRSGCCPVFMGAINDMDFQRISNVTSSVKITNFP